MRLPELRANDLRRLSDFIGGMNLCKDSIELESLVHTQLRTLVDGDVTVFNEIGIRGEICHASTWPVFGESFWNLVAPAIALNLHEHPFIIQINRSYPLLHAMRLSDGENYGNFLQSTLYNEAYKEWDCKYMCFGSIDTGHQTHIALEVNRQNHDFSVRDLQMFQALVPYLRAKNQKLQLLEKLQFAVESNGNGINGDSLFWLSLGPLLYIRNLSSSARRILDTAFPRSTVAFQLPSEIKNRLLSYVVAWNTADTPMNNRRASFEVRDESRHLSCTFQQKDAANFHLKGADKTRMSSKNNDRPELGTLEKLTNCELEVLRWTCQGKTNPETAILLNIQLKTVERHLTSIFEKLNIKSRMVLIRRFGSAWNRL